MKKRTKGGKKNARNEYEQLSFFDLLANDNTSSIRETFEGEEQTTLFSLEDEKLLTEKTRILDIGNQSALQSGVTGIDTEQSNNTVATSGIYDGSEKAYGSSEGNDNGLVHATGRNGQKSLSRICLDAESDKRLSVKDKIEQNLQAIRLLSDLRYTNAKATEEEQRIMAGFSGWGGCPHVFNENDNKYMKERSELKELLSVDEYKDAKESTLTSFYTPLNVIDNMYQILDRFGFKEGSILETSLGTGNFIGMMPEDMFDNSDIHGIELDKISSEIASQLYQGTTVVNTGFEKCPYPDNVFDLAISNVPFGNFQLHDKELNKYHFNIHNYFFAKALQKVRNGGLIAFITSLETMDGNNGVMSYINERADFLGAIRLPNNTFMKNGANTQITADIIFLKRNDDKVIDYDHITTQRIDVTDHRKMNRYFVENPHMVFGTIKEQKNQFGGFEITVVPDDTPLQERFDSILNEFKEVYTEREEVVNDTVYKEVGVEHSQYPVDAFFIENDILHYRDANEYYEIKTIEQLKGIDIRDNHIAFKKESDIDKVKHMITLVDKTIEIVDIQARNIDEDIYLTKRAELNTVYDSFVKQYGALHKTTNMPLISSDPRAYLLHSLEDYNPKTKEIKKSAIFTERTINAKKEIKEVDNIQDGLRVCLDSKGKIDLGYIAVLYKKSEQEIHEELLNEGLVYIEPISEELILADDYLSGNVRKKHDIALSYGYEDNVKALEQVMPETIKAEDIKAQLGSAWIPEKYIKEFVVKCFELEKEWSIDQLKINYDKILGAYVIEHEFYPTAIVENIWGVGKSSIDIVADWKSQPKYTGYDLLEDVLNSRIPTLRNYWSEWNEEKQRDVEKSELNSDRTTQARELAEKLNEEWEEWVFSDYDRKQHLEELYNEKFNSVRLQEYDGSYLTFPEMSNMYQLEPYQKNAVARIMKPKNTLLWQQVGAGKTFEMVSAGMEMKRLGIRNKILYVVPNHLLSQWENDFLALYPKSNLLVANKKDFAKDKRQVFINKIATGSYDAIIMAHSSFKFLSVSHDLQIKHMEREIAEVENAISDIENSDDKSTKRVKMLERTKKSIEKNIQKLTDTKRDENLIPFDKLGIDYMFVDESHEFKNLYTYTAMNNVVGLQTQHSQKASDMLMKVKIIEEHGGNVCFATGTPVTNTMAELYTLQRYLQEDALYEMDIYCFDAWAKAFGKVINSFEISIDGTRFVNRSRFCKFFNVQELMTQFKQVAEIQTAGMLRKELENSKLGRKSAIPPTHKGGKAQIITLEPSEELEAYITDIVKRTEAIHDGGVDPRVDNMLKVTSDSKKASIDMRLIDPTYADEENGKLSVIAKTIKKLYTEYDEQKATQLVFCDSSTPNNKTHGMKLVDGVYVEDMDTFQNVYEEIKNKLIQQGIPEQEIAFIHDYNTELSKTDLFKKMNEGKMRVLFGSTKKLGAGTNVQQRLIAVHHVDVPWKASDIQQQNGRAFRQGNMFKEIYEYRYVTKKSFDAYSWQMVETKSTYMTQLMEGTSAMREMEEDMQSVFSFAEIKAIASGNPIIKEKYEVDSEVKRLESLKKQYQKKKYNAQDDVVRLPKRLKYLEDQIYVLKGKVDTFAGKIYRQDQIEDKFVIFIKGREYHNTKDAWNIIMEMCEHHDFAKQGKLVVAQFLGQDLLVDSAGVKSISLSTPHGEVKIEGWNDYVGRVNFARIIRKVNELSKTLEEKTQEIANVKKAITVAKQICESKFEHDDSYHTLRQRQKEINRELEETGKDIMQEEIGQEQSYEMSM